MKIWVIIVRSNKIGYLPLLHRNHKDNQSENWCLVGLLNIDVYSSGVNESNSKPVSYIMDTNYV